MLLLIVNQLHFLDGRFSGYVDKASKEELKRADVILTTLETAGMHPPTYAVSLDEDSRTHTAILMWEPEDEE